jgi:hypothetical protein
MVKEYKGIGYFAEYNNNSPTRDIVKVGFTESKFTTSRSVIVGSRLGDFLTTMIEEGLNVASEGKPLKISLTEIMRKNGMISEFSVVDYFDLAVKTGVKNGGSDDILGSKPRNNEGLINMVKFLGLDGMLKYLFAEMLISFDQLKSLFHHFYGPPEIREEAFRDINPFIRQKGIILSDSQVKELLHG